MNKKYKVLKLKTGEELITTILRVEDGIIELRCPMVFKSGIYPNPLTGTQKEITILRDWIENTSDSSVSIPSSFILSFSSADSEAVELYEQELERKKESKKKRKIKKIDDITKKDLQKELEDLLDEAENKNNPNTTMFGMIPISEDFLKEMMENIENLANGEVEFEMDFSFMFPSEEMNPDVSTEEEYNHPDFGNRWTDWSSNPNDY